MNDLKFLINNFLYPEGKIRVKLGDSSEGINYLNYFNKRSLKRLFIKNKKYNCSIIDASSFKSELDYYSTIKGKNSADYFARRCEKLGYTFTKFDPNQEIESIYKINTSTNTRQGKLMEGSYLNKVEKWENSESNEWYGVYSKENELVAYLWSIKLNELVLINRILGNFNHLNNNVMYLLTSRFIGNVIVQGGVKYIMYDTFGRKKNGLVLYKKRIGFKAFTVNFTK
jgi:hypothetical protein